MKMNTTKSFWNLGVPIPNQTWSMQESENSEQDLTVLLTCFTFLHEAGLGCGLSWPVMIVVGCALKESSWALQLAYLDFVHSEALQSVRPSYP